MDERILIVLAILAVLFFGGKRLEDLSKSAGRAMGEFKKGREEAEAEYKALAKKK